MTSLFDEGVARVSFVGGLVPLTDIAALTGNKGNFVLSALAAGECTVEVVSEGFVSKRVRISTGTNLEKRVEIQLFRVN